MATARARALRRLRPYWGYLVLGALVLAVTQGADPALLAGLSALVGFYGLFQVPLPCGAPNRQEGTYCRNNGHGLLRGCHLRAHKWAKFKLVARRSAVGRWREALRGLWPKDSGTARLQTLAAFATIISSVGGLLIAIITAISK